MQIGLSPLQVFKLADKESISTKLNRLKKRSSTASKAIMYIADVLVTVHFPKNVPLLGSMYIGKIKDNCVREKGGKGD